MSFTNSPNMNFPVPSVANEPGPQYANDINQALMTLDGHNHNPGFGVPIGSQGLNLLTDLTFNINNATSLRTARFISTTATSGTDIGCVYVKGVDLFYNDLNANVVRITQNGGLASTATFIGNISTTAITSAAGPTPATSGFIRMNNNSDFVSWRNAANNADDRIYFDNNDNLRVIGNVNGGVTTYGLNLLDQVAGKQVLITSINNTSAYTATFPTNPPTSSMPISMSVSGGLTSQAITRPQLPNVGQIISQSCGAYTSTTASYLTVGPNFCTISTNGRPVMCIVQPDGTNNDSSFSNSGNFTGISFRVLRNTTLVARTEYSVASNTNIPPNLMFMDLPTASSSYTYYFQMNANGALASVLNTVLAVYEL